MAIRKFEYKDLESVVKIAHDSLEEKYTTDFFLHLWSIAPDGFLVAEKNDAVVGFIITIEPCINELRILMLAVDEKYRGQGIGSSLLREAILRHPETRRIYLEVRVDNKEAILFYKRKGFKIKQMLPDFYTDGSPAYLMEKIFF